MDFTGVTILFLAFGAGLLHALDADHVMAVTAIASKKMGMKAIVAQCLKWSLGHGAIIFIAGALILLFGLSIPHELSQHAEKVVAIILIVIGGWILKDLYQSRAHIHFHKHEGLTRHAHWHVDQAEKLTIQQPLKSVKNRPTEKYKQLHSHDHKAVIVGIVHGLAGLAPLLAIIPVTNQAPLLGVAYLLIFCIGVFLSMLVFGGALGKILAHIQGYSLISINFVRGAIGFASVSLGVIWLV